MKTTKKNILSNQTLDLFNCYMQLQDGSNEKKYLCERLFTAYMWLANETAKSFCSKVDFNDIDEATQICNIALFKAIQRFNPERGVPFVPFAKNQMYYDLKKMDNKLIHIPDNVAWDRVKLDKTESDFLQCYGRDPSEKELAYILKWSLKRVHTAKRSKKQPESMYVSNSEEEYAIEIADENSMHPFEEVETRDLIGYILKNLNVEEKEVLIMNANGFTLRQIGVKIGFSSETARNRLSQALKHAKALVLPSSIVKPSNKICGQKESFSYEKGSKKYRSAN